jgi:hypothetical protein
LRKIKRYILRSVNFFKTKIAPLTRYYGKNAVQLDRPQMHMQIACRILKSADTYSEYVILLAFPLQQWFRESASVAVVTGFNVPPTQCIYVDCMGFTRTGVYFPIQH